jgi:hypothetical protein
MKIERKLNSCRAHRKFNNRPIRNENFKYTALVTPVVPHMEVEMLALLHHMSMTPHEACRGLTESLVCPATAQCPVSCCEHSRPVQKYEHTVI